MTSENISAKSGRAELPRFPDDPLSLPLKSDASVGFRPFRASEARGRRWGLWSLALFFFLLPLQTRWIFREAPLYEWGTLSVYGVEVLGWVVILISLMGTWEHGNMGTKLKKCFLVYLLPCFFSVWAFASIAWAPDKLVALQGAMVLLGGVMIYLILCSARIHPRQSLESNRLPALGGKGWPSSRLDSSDAKASHYMFIVFVAGAALQSMLGIYQFLTQSSFASKWLGMALHDPRALGTSVVEFANERWLRAYGSMPHPNVLGGFLVLALVLCYMRLQNVTGGYGRLQEVTRGYPRLFLKMAIPILLTGIFFSFSRAAWVAAVGLLGYWVIGLLQKTHALQSNQIVGSGLVPDRGGAPSKGGQASPTLQRGPGERQPGWSGRFYFLLITLYIIFLALIFRSLVFTRVASESRLEVKSRVERVEGLREAWALIKKHPALGVGMGNYTQAVARDLRPGQPLYTYQPVHNVFMLVWAELGIVGLLLFVVALYFIFKYSKPEEDQLPLSCHPRPRSGIHNTCTLVDSRFRGNDSLRNVVMLSCFFVLMMSDHFLWSLPFGVFLFWGVMGLFFSRHSEPRRIWSG